MAQGVDERRVAERGVLADHAVQREVLEALRVRVVGAGLAVDEAEQPLAGRAEEVVAAVVRRAVQRGHVGGALEGRGQRLAGVGGEVDDRLAGVEALDEQHVHPGLVELAGLRRTGDVHAQHPVTGVRVVSHVERAVAGGDDRRVVDGVRAGDLDERAVAGTGHRAGLELVQREPVRSRHRDAAGAEVRRAGEVDDRRAERIGLRRRVLQRHGLHGGRVADRDVRQLRRVVHPQIGRGAFIGGVEQHVPDLLLVRGALVRDAGIDREARRFVAQVDLQRAFQRQMVARQQAAERPEPVGLARRLVRRRRRRGVRPGGHDDGDHPCRGERHRGRRQPPSSCLLC